MTRCFIMLLKFKLFEESHTTASGMRYDERITLRNPTCTSQGYEANLTTDNI